MKLLHNFEDVIILGSGRALILPHAPDNLSMEVVQNHMQEHPQDVTKLGLFEAASPNYTTYYPDVKAEDFVVKEEDLFKPLVRALSQVVVHKNYNPVDFSKGNVLKDSQSLLYGQTIYVDHETSTGNALGSISETLWQGDYKAQNGVMVPAGINARLQIDGKSHPNIVRKMSMKPPAIHSVSVTVQFAWEPSHKQMPIDEFMGKIGTFDDKGNMYMRIANGVKVYKEISLVSHGADPFAQLIGADGNINNPKYASLVYNSADGKPKGVKYHFIDFREGLISNSEEDTIPDDISNIDTPTPKIMKRETLLLLAAALSVPVTDGLDDVALNALIEPKLTAYVSGNQTAQTELTNAQAKVTDLQGKVAAAETKVIELETKLKDAPGHSTVGEAALTAARGETLRLATLLNSNKAPEGPQLKLINDSPYETLQFLQQSYQAQVDTQFPLTCTKCGGHEVNRASAKVIENSEESNHKAPIGIDALKAKLQDKRTNTANNLHGTATV